jgi:hypothetical protein
MLEEKDFKALTSILSAFYTIELPEGASAETRRIDLLIQAVRCFASVVYTLSNSHCEGNSGQVNPMKCSSLELLVDSLEVMVQRAFAPNEAFLPPPQAKHRWDGTKRDFYLVFAHVYRRLSIEAANKQEFSAALEHIHIASRIYAVASRAGAGVGKDVWGWQVAVGEGCMRRCMEADAELSKFVMASQYAELITGGHIVQTEREIQDARARRELHVKAQRYETRAERAMNKHEYSAAIDECRLGKEMLEALPSGRSNSEWLTELLARLERIEHEAMRKKQVLTYADVC